jgi:hypothetical protein
MKIFGWQADIWKTKVNSSFVPATVFGRHQTGKQAKRKRSDDGSEPNVLDAAHCTMSALQAGETGREGVRSPRYSGSKRDA